MSTTKRMRIKPQGELRVVQPFPPHAYWQLFTWLQDNWHVVADDSSPQDVESFIAQQEALDRSLTNGLPTQLTWGVYRGDELGGYVRFSLNPSRIWQGELHVAYKRDFWGYDTTAESLKVVGKELFDLGITKINMVVFPENRAVRGLAGTIGAIEEGRMRRAVKRDGEYTDLVLLGITPEEFAFKEQPCQEL